MVAEYRNPLRQPEYFLLGGPLPDRGLLAQYRLVPYAYTRLADGHPERPALRNAFLRRSARHIAIKAKLLPLVRAWCDAGIEVLIFKGFYLAEFVYPASAQRPYGDVDVLVRTEHSGVARQIAQAMGWQEVWARDASLYVSNHEEARLDSPGEFRIELHRYILDSHGPFDALQRRLTAAAWSSSTEQVWEDMKVRILAPVDSLLMGLVLARAWSASDRWQLKPHDFLDMQNVADRFGLGEDALRERAKVLRCARTLDLFLARCNPWKGNLDLTQPTLLQRQYGYLAVMPERGHLGLERLLITLLKLPAMLSDLIRYLPDVWRIRRLLLRESEIRQVVKILGHCLATRQPRSLREEERIARGVRWGVRLLWPLTKDVCLPRALALYAAYRSRGYPAVFYSGIGKAGGREQPHGWVTLASRRLEDLLDLENCEVSRVCYRYPSGSRHADQADARPTPR